MAADAAELLARCQERGARQAERIATRKSRIQSLGAMVERQQGEEERLWFSEEAKMKEEKEQSDNQTMSEMPKARKDRR